MKMKGPHAGGMSNHVLNLGDYAVKLRIISVQPKINYRS